MSLTIQNSSLRPGNEATLNPAWTWVIMLMRQVHDAAFRFAFTTKHPTWYCLDWAWHWFLYIRSLVQWTEATYELYLILPKSHWLHNNLKGMHNTQNCQWRLRSWAHDAPSIFMSLLNLLCMTWAELRLDLRAPAWKLVFQETNLCNSVLTTHLILSLPGQQYSC